MVKCLHFTMTYGLELVFLHNLDFSRPLRFFSFSFSVTNFSTSLWLIFWVQIAQHLVSKFLKTKFTGSHFFSCLLVVYWNAWALQYRTCHHMCQLSQASALKWMWTCGWLLKPNIGKLNHSGKYSKFWFLLGFQNSYMTRQECLYHYPSEHFFTHKCEPLLYRCPSE